MPIREKAKIIWVTFLGLMGAGFVLWEPPRDYLHILIPAAWILVYVVRHYFR